MANIIVRFNVNEKKEVKGSIVKDDPERKEIRRVPLYDCPDNRIFWYDEDLKRHIVGYKNVEIKKQERSKIVFLWGYRPERFHEWNGSLPRNNEVWECEEVKDSQPDNPRKGALIVKTLNNVTALEKQKRIEEDPRWSVVFELLPDFRMDELDRLMAFAQIVKKQGLTQELQAMTKQANYFKALRRSRELKISLENNLAWTILQPGEPMPYWLEQLRAVLIWLGVSPDDDKLEIRPELCKPVEFSYEGKRHFRCSCGAITRLGKQQMKQLEINGADLLICEYCGGRGEICV